ncbi:MAG: sulfatase family protein [Bryobacteraceae bacterium]
MDRRQFLGASAVLWQRPQRPNIVLYMPERQPVPELSGAVRFPRFYSAHPDPAPARAAVLTGRFPHACGVTREGQVLTSSERMISGVLRESGYRSTLAGAWPAAEAIREIPASLDPAPFLLAVAIEDSLGVVLRALDRAGAVENTLVISTTALGTRVPLRMRYPRLLKGDQTNETLLSGVDLMPTLLGLCGANVPVDVHGHDLSGALFHGGGESTSSVFSYGRLGTPEEWRMIVRGYDKLIVNRAGQATHLYNLAEDPEEARNLVSEPGHTLRIDELRAQLASWRRRIGDGMNESGLKKRD